MFETTYRESYRDDSIQHDEEEQEEPDPEKIAYRYRVLEELVGVDRIDMLQKEVREKLANRVAGGPNILRRSFKYFNKSGTGEINHEEFFLVCASMGIQLSRQEAAALFGRFDVNKDGGIVYYEFIDSTLPNCTLRAHFTELMNDGATRDAKYYEKK
jgi:hypothetical protein